MTEKQFDSFLERTIKNFGDEYIDFSEDTIIQHTFSREFERKMSKLIKQQKSFYFPMIKTPVRRIVIVLITAAIVLSTMVISVTAIREAFINFITEIFDTHTEVQIIQDDTAPDFFEDIYAITDIPDGFEIVFQNDNIEETPLLITEYQNGQEYVIFCQNIKSKYDVNVNTEGYEMIQIYINGNEGFMIDMGDDIYITWDNGKYILEISGNIGKDELIGIANSVQKVE
ncbi:MAG: DUF4367 domain-containing protein [Oscillospiraceae bacterium]